MQTTLFYELKILKLNINKKKSNDCFLPELDFQEVAEKIYVNQI